VDTYIPECSHHVFMFAIAITNMTVYRRSCQHDEKLFGVDLSNDRMHGRTVKCFGLQVVTSNIELSACCLSVTQSVAVIPLPSLATYFKILTLNKLVKGAKTRELN